MDFEVENHIQNQHFQSTINRMTEVEIFFAQTDITVHSVTCLRERQTTQEKFDRTIRR